MILVERGEVVREGLTHEVTAVYERAANEFAQTPLLGATTTSNHKKAEITSVAFYDSEGHEATTFITGEPLAARIKYNARESVSDVFFEILFLTRDNQMQCQLRTDLNGEFINLDRGTGEIEFSCGALGMQPNVYNVEAKIMRREVPMDVDHQVGGAILRVEPGKFVHGQFYMPHQWRFMKNGVGCLISDAL
ncbi:MAG: Wzt carbohydrate-binding domain-containing protein [Acidobacteriota bacterium]|nr:Wzt carbohydrate-binding domain-containing protein [Acidobacteriota bacterium]